MPENKIAYDDFFEIITIKMPRRMKILREIFNYSQEGVAIQMNISQTNYGNYERGTQPVSPQKLMDFCKVFNITPDEFIAFDLTEIIKKAKLNI